MFARLQRPRPGKIPVVLQERTNGEYRLRVLVLAARQPDLLGLLEEAGFSVEARKMPTNGSVPDADLAVVFRGRMIGRNQAVALNQKGIPVIEVLTSEPTSPSTAGWLRLSNRISKPDLVQIVRAVADWATRERSPRPA
jgi:hypothetical protein